MRNNDLWGTKVTKTFAYTLLYMIIFVFVKELAFRWRWRSECCREYGYPLGKKANNP